MEGWIIWIIIIIAWAVISNLSEKKETEDYVEALQENRFTIFVEEGIPPKKTGFPNQKTVTSPKQSRSPVGVI